MEDESAPPIEMTSDPEMRRMLGLFDAPAFARRGRELEYSLSRRARATGSATIRDARDRPPAAPPMVGRGRGPRRRPRAVFWESIEPPLAAHRRLARASPVWSEVRGASPRSDPTHRQRADLIASVEQPFNARWARLLGELKLDGVNQAIEHYNRYYLIEKECVMGSARLAARHFVPRPLITPEILVADFPPLPVPRLR